MAEQTDRQQQDKLKLLQAQKDIRDVMDTPGGRRLMYKLLSRAGIYQCSFTGQSNQTIFNEGGRNQGLMILADIQTAAPGSYLTMIKENNDG